MKRIFSALVLLTLSVGGCGDDDTDDGNTGGSSSAGKKSDAGEPATSGGDGTGGAPAGNVGCDPEADGVCQNAADCPFVVNGEARKTAGQCGLDCLESTAETCAVDCIVEKTETMTPECATCYAGAVACATENCLSACIADTESPGCKQCQVDKGCREEFNTCSGLPE